MIKNKATGDLAAFACKNRLSKTTLCEILTEMKEMGFPIKYDRLRRTYYYTEEGQMVSGMFFRYGEPLTREASMAGEEMKNMCFSPQAVFVPCVKD
ncbi:hypothetical protein MKQ68_11545 [Chitinophaga horti]|uniref:Uncharacterized protein n=1 Tax=Chitinophaga horti TaxID=2920382 RepID=A0ABY6J7S7_9BACT|nr:hypothetical protein [Chitinophaga horti]UYQ95736.1 hypothetical protein MKQ68_11545 [Chitinophaga horti]